MATKKPPAYACSCGHVTPLSEAVTYADTGEVICQACGQVGPSPYSSEVLQSIEAEVAESMLRQSVAWQWMQAGDANRKSVYSWRKTAG